MKSCVNTGPTRLLATFIAALLFVLLAAFTAADASLPVGKPNIIFILGDDLGYGDLGCYGQKRIKTPNLDRMAAEGFRFTQHYAGSTVCAPSRCALLTGRHTGHGTIRGNGDGLLKNGEPTLASVLKSAGYRTACVGKWGIGHPPPPGDPQRCGFDSFFGYLSMWHAHNSYPEFLWRNSEKVPLRNVVRHPVEHYKDGQAELTGYAEQRSDFAPDLFTQEALQVIRAKDRPFFLMLCYPVPHANNEARELGAAHGIEVPHFGPYHEESWPAVEKAKAAVISRMDADIGSLFEELKTLEIDGGTLVLFSSDNGPHREGGVKPEFFQSSGPLRGGKRDLYEGGIRVPLLARWPGHIKAGRISDHPSAFWDMLPTFAELAGLAVPKETDGLSLVPELMGRAQPAHEYLYWEFHEGASQQAVRKRDWKAVRLAPSKPIELYDLQSDPGETRNVADSNTDVVRAMEEIFHKTRSDERIWPLQETPSNTQPNKK